MSKQLGLKELRQEVIADLKTDIGEKVTRIKESPAVHYAGKNLMTIFGSSLVIGGFLKTAEILSQSKENLENSVNFANLITSLSSMAVGVYFLARASNDSTGNMARSVARSFTDIKNENLRTATVVFSGIASAFSIGSFYALYINNKLRFDSLDSWFYSGAALGSLALLGIAFVGTKDGDNFKQ